MAYHTTESAVYNLSKELVKNNPEYVNAVFEKKMSSENIYTEVERCESYAKSLKFFYMFGILAVYVLLFVRVILWIMLLSTLYRIIKGAHATTVPIDVETNSETICIKHNHDCGESNNPCSSWLTRWRARIRGTDKDKTFIINTIGSSPTSPPTHICKQGNMYTYPCKTVMDLIHQFFMVLMFIIVIEIIYNGYLYSPDCTFSFKTIYGVPSYAILILFIAVYSIVLISTRRIGDAMASMKDDMSSFWNMFS